MLLINHCYTVCTLINHCYGCAWCRYSTVAYTIHHTLYTHGAHGAGESGDTDGGADRNSCHGVPMVREVGEGRLCRGSVCTAYCTLVHTGCAEVVCVRHTAH
jgi:hypothetical protein